MMRVARISDSMRGSTPGRTLGGANVTPLGAIISLHARRTSAVNPRHGRKSNAVDSMWDEQLYEAAACFSFTEHKIDGPQSPTHFPSYS